MKARASELAHSFFFANPDLLSKLLSQIFCEAVVNLWLVGLVVDTSCSNCIIIVARFQSICLALDAEALSTGLMTGSATER